MKFTIITFAAVLFSSAHAFECTQNEAQFIGKVSELREVNVDQGIRDCYYKIQFTRFDSSMICPLDEVTATSAELLDSDCKMSLENGKEISGYLVEKDGLISLDN